MRGWGSCGWGSIPRSPTKKLLEDSDQKRYDIFMFSHYRILLYSEDPDELMKFYRDVLGLELEQKLDIPNDYGYRFTIHDEYKLWIGKHSEIHGKNKEPFRHIFNLYVNSVSMSYEKIRDKAEIISTPEETPFSTIENPVYVSTFLDPEKNCWQFMGGK